MSRSLRVLVLGGTRFIGRALVFELVNCGHSVAVVHRGEHEGELPPEVPHIHADRGRLAERAVAVLDPALPVVAASSADVYRAFRSLYEGTATDAVPLREDAPLRAEAPPDQVVMPGWSYEADLYEKRDVERIYLERGATICRLPLVYGEHDYRRREEFVLSRARAGRDRIPVGSGTLLLSRGYAPEIARGLRLAVERSPQGEIFNLAEQETATVRLWIQEILAVADHQAELVRVPEEQLPDDLGLTAEFQQPLVVDCSKAERELGWTHAPWRECVASSVRWHLANPPQRTQSFEADDTALTEARRSAP
jgi:nucleoside-diphosphate-sugar epimerase